jgi:ribosomal protein S18 acetylase RimI-like enzyme
MDGSEGPWAPLRGILGVQKDYPKELILKDGTGVTLRPLGAGDEAPLRGMFDRFSESDRWFLDHDVTDAGVIEGWVKGVDLERIISIVAVLEGRIIGLATLTRKYYGSKSHIGRIRISIDPAFRERHLGTWMLLDLINLAMAMGLEILSMQFVKDRDLYALPGVKKLGFSEKAVLPDYLKDREGNSHDLVILVKRLQRGWNDTGAYPP